MHAISVMREKTVSVSVSRRWRRIKAYIAGLVLGNLLLVILLLPQTDSLHARGPLNPGHENLACCDCHRPSPGNARQQLQASVRFLLGWRSTPVAFLHEDVTTEICLDCHPRPNDRHPVYRFLEPRFAEVRSVLAPHRCLSCHREHQGQRMALGESGFCRHCHENTKLRKDPLDVAHDRLIVLGLWDTCLGCHDFHGNHIRTTPTSVDDLIPATAVLDYFRSGPSPYGDNLHHPAKRGGRHDG